MSGPPQDSDSDEDEAGAISSRWPELIVAAVMAALAGLVIADSLRVGIGWADDGPRAGYFPFYIGLLLLGASLWVIVGQLLKRKQAAAFVSRAAGMQVLAVLWPMGVYVALIKLLGIYVASALLIGWFMHRHGEHRVRTKAAVALGVPIAFFLVFERWFLVPLPKGPLEALFGL